MALRVQPGLVDEDVGVGSDARDRAGHVVIHHVPAATRRWL